MNNSSVKSAYLQVALRPLLAMAVDIAEKIGGIGSVKKQKAREWLRDLYRANGCASEMSPFQECQDRWIEEVVLTKNQTQTWFADLNAVSVSHIVGALKLADS